MGLTRDWIIYPDDLANAYAVLRAWDRHLLSVDLLPIGTSELDKVGPILVDPEGTGEFYTYCFDSRGFLILTTASLLSEARVWKASCEEKE